MQTYNISFTFNSMFVAHPYWPEMYQVIEIQKKSGVNRARSEANRRKALEEYLRQHGMTLQEYEQLVALSQRPFHTNSDGYIYIPPVNTLAFLTAVCDEARAAYKPCNKDQVRARFQVTPLVTDRTEPDGTWRRFATVNMGSGAKASNQRALRENAYIENFTAKGEISFDEQTVDPGTLQNALLWGGRFVGIGASRKMGCGRFDLTEFALNSETPLQVAAE